MRTEEKLQAYRAAQEGLSRPGRRVTLVGKSRKPKPCPVCYKPIPLHANIVNWGQVGGYWRWICLTCAPDDPRLSPVVKELIPEGNLPDETDEDEPNYFMRADQGSLAVYWYFGYGAYDYDDCVPWDCGPIIAAVPLVGMVESRGSLVPVVVEPGTGRLLEEPTCFAVDSGNPSSEFNVQLLGYDREGTFDEVKWLAIVTESPEHEHWLMLRPEYDDFDLVLPFYLKECPAARQGHVEEYPYDARRCPHCWAYMDYFTDGQRFFTYEAHLLGVCHRCGCAFYRGGD
jgi:hypothetical protein